MNVITDVLWYFVKYKWLEFIESFLSMWHGERYGILEEKAFTSLTLKISQGLRESKTDAHTRCVSECVCVQERERYQKTKKETRTSEGVSAGESEDLITSVSFIPLPAFCMWVRKRMNNNTFSSQWRQWTDHLIQARQQNITFTDGVLG